MGMDAKVTIWVGIDLQSSELDWEDDVLPKLPDSIKDEDGLNWDDDVIKAALGGVLVETVSCCDECVGFGIIIFDHNWDHGVAEFDIADLAKKEQEAIAVIRPLLEEWTIVGKVGTFVQTDYR